MRTLIGEGARLVGASPYVTLLLHGEAGKAGHPPKINRKAPGEPMRVAGGASQDQMGTDAIRSCPRSLIVSVCPRSDQPGQLRGGTGQVRGGLRGHQEQVLLFSADETTDIGREAGTPVSADYDRHGSVFSGRVNWGQIDLGKDDHDHFISPEERLRIAMARQ